MNVAQRSRVKLPAGIGARFEVYLNGVRQEPGRDFTRHGDLLVFERPLAKEGRLGFWRWLIGAFGIGTYGRDDQVDVTWEVDGQPRVAHHLDIEART